MSLAKINLIRNLLNNKNFFEKKIISYNITYKYIIRRFEYLHQNILLLDSDFSLKNSIVTTKKQLKRYKKKKIISKGNSISLKMYSFKHNLNKNIRFKMPFYFKSNNNNFSKIFNQLKIPLEMEETKTEFFLLIEPTKGGFIVYSSMYFGFIAFSNYKLINFCFFNINFTKKLEFIKEKKYTLKWIPSKKLSFLFFFPIKRDQQYKKKNYRNINIIFIFNIKKNNLYKKILSYLKKKYENKSFKKKNYNSRHNKSIFK
jgi:hypothetical protein